MFGAMLGVLYLMDSDMRAWSNSAAAQVEALPAAPPTHVDAEPAGSADDWTAPDPEPASVTDDSGWADAEDAASVPAAAVDVREVTSDDGYLNFRAWPSLESELVTTIPAGALVEVERCDVADDVGRQWCKVSYAGEEGWVAGSYLAAPPARGAPPPVRVSFARGTSSGVTTGTVSAGGTVRHLVRVRRGQPLWASTDGYPVRVYPPGRPVAPQNEVPSTGGDSASEWYGVTTESGDYQIVVGVGAGSGAYSLSVSVE